MARLKSRQKFIPGGFKFYQPETGWRSPANASFQVIVNALIAHRRGQPFLVDKHKWSLEPEAVADELDVFNATVCEKMGWKDYIHAGTGGEFPIPKFNAPSVSDPSKLAAVAGRVKKIWSGIRTLNEWDVSGDPAVPQEQAESRARACGSCNKNTPGDFTSWFTQPAAEAIRRQMRKREERQLTTSLDDRINVCAVCLCPLKLKVHTPMKHIQAHMSEEVMAELKGVPGCWVIEELKT